MDNIFQRDNPLNRTDSWILNYSELKIVRSGGVISHQTLHPELLGSAGCGSKLLYKYLESYGYTIAWTPALELVMNRVWNTPVMDWRRSE